MRDVSMVYFRRYTTDLIGLVAYAGETLQLTKEGRPIAWIVPVPKPNSVTDPVQLLLAQAQAKPDEHAPPEAHTAATTSGGALEPRENPAGNTSKNAGKPPKTRPRAAGGRRRR